MKNKTTQSIPALLALFGCAFTQISYWCMYSGGSCYGTWVSHIYQYFTNPLYNFSLYFLPVALILIFLPRSLFISWLKFVAWAIPLLIIFIAITPVSFSGLGINFFPFYRDDAARLAGLVFSAVSLILIIWKYFVARKAHSV